jgi:hypothetical protein
MHLSTRKMNSVGEPKHTPVGDRAGQPGARGDRHGQARAGEPKHTPAEILQPTPAEMLMRYQGFVNYVAHFFNEGARGPDLSKAIETGSVNMDAVGYMLAGCTFETFTDPPGNPPF